MLSRQTSRLKPPLRIGVDIDGCIFDQFSAIVQYSRDYFNITIDPSKCTQFDLSKTTPLTTAHMRQMFQDPRYHALLKPLPDAQFVLSRLSSWHYWIELVSARYDSLYDITYNSLETFNIPYDMMFLGIKNKVLHARNNRLEYFIEDRWKNAENLSKSLTGVFLISASWNSNRREKDHPHMIRVKTTESSSAWMQILDYFIKIKQERGT